MLRKHRDLVQDEILKEEENSMDSVNDNEAEKLETEGINENIAEDDDIAGIDKDTILSMEGIMSELIASNKKITDENNKLNNEIEALREKLIRISAEYENHRKRTIKEKEGIYSDACEDVLKNMFPVLDNLERAYSVEGSNEDIKKGIEMTIRQFKTGLDKVLVEEIPTDGEFDPNFHNAVMHIEDTELDKNQIVEVFQKGYKRGEKVLRHSMVKVAN